MTFIHYDKIYKKLFTRLCRCIIINMKIYCITCEDYRFTLILIKMSF